MAYDYSDRRQRKDLYQWMDTLLQDPPQPEHVDALNLSELADYIVAGGRGECEAGNSAVADSAVAVVFCFRTACDDAAELGSGRSYYFVAVAGGGRALYAATRLSQAGMMCLRHGRILPCHDASANLIATAARLTTSLFLYRK